MKTRSQTRYELEAMYEVNIDFDAASEAWKKNKVSIGNGSYGYLCAKCETTGIHCKKPCIQGKDYCSKHYKQFQAGKL
jgi:hypothetical protein